MWRARRDQDRYRVSEIVDEEDRQNVGDCSLAAYKLLWIHVQRWRSRTLKSLSQRHTYTGPWVGILQGKVENVDGEKSAEIANTALGESTQLPLLSFSTDAIPKQP